MTGEIGTVRSAAGSQGSPGSRGPLRWPGLFARYRPRRDTVARIGLAAGGLSILATVTIGLLGPSAMVPALPGGPRQPPYSLGLFPDGHLVIALAAAAVLLGAAGLACGLSAIRRMPSARHLLLAGCLAAAALAVLPPSGSPDHLNYAAYGRIAVLGHNPYVTVPADLPADPVVGAVEEWRTVPSVYGPVATAVQILASRIGGDSVRLTVFVLALVNAAAFISAGLLLHRATRDDPVRQRRAALLWTANPLLLYQLAAGMHLDTLAIALVTAGLVWRRGVPLGLGIAVKVTSGLAALGLAWELRRRPGRLVLVAGAATVTVLAVYWPAGPHALDQVLNASASVSWATPWKLVQRAAQLVFGPGAYRAWIRVGSLLLLVVLAAVLLRGIGVPDGTRRGGQAGAQVALVVVTAWLFATPYALPWYDGLAFALLALAARPCPAAFLVARLTLLSLAYLPARQHGPPADLGWLVTVVRAQVVPWLLTALTIGLLCWGARAATRARMRPATAVPPR